MPRKRHLANLSAVGFLALLALIFLWDFAFYLTDPRGGLVSFREGNHKSLLEHRETLTLVSWEPTFAEIDIFVTKNSPSYVLTIRDGNATDMASVQTAKKPKHGTIYISRSTSSVRYKPYKHYTGLDNFSLSGVVIDKADNQLVLSRGQKAEVNVTVRVCVAIALTSETSMLNVGVVNNSERTDKVIKDIRRYLSTSDFLKKAVLPYDALGEARIPVCAVVGNGALLHKSRCGPQIDSADLVFRFNRKSIQPNFWSADWKDSGKKIDVMVFNRLVAYNSGQHLSDLVNDLYAAVDSTDPLNSHKKFVLLFNFVKPFEYQVFNMLAGAAPLSHTLSSTNVDLFMFSSDWTSLADDILFGKNRFHTRFASTGFIGALTAIAMCDVVHLYGFGKMPGNSREHYFSDSQKHAWSGHNMNDEHYVLKQMSGGFVPPELKYFNLSKNIIYHRKACV